MDLSAISPRSQNIYTGSVQTSLFTVYDNNGTCGALNIEALVAPPSGGNAALVRVDGTSKSITFAASAFLTDSGNYTVTIKVGYDT